jgi:hypothetical protein
VAIHDPATATVAREAWLARLRKFGVQIDARHLVIPGADALAIRRLGDPDPA